MRYLGSKLRLFKYIGPIIQKYIDDNNIRLYIEPFVGGANVIDKIKCEKRKCLDANPNLVCMWRALQAGWNPPDNITKGDYQDIKREYKEGGHKPNALYGFVGIACAFSGSWFAGYSEAKGRNRCLESKRTVLRQIQTMKDVWFDYGDYSYTETFIKDEVAVIYCDPPYQGIHLYPGSEQEFNTNEFWRWAVRMAGYNIVLVSEYECPEWVNADILWQQEVLVNAHQTNQKKKVEKLYLVKG